ncbi:hypothetical protein [Leclercia adecarboxylata]|uniref:hypothetical protein n=1 Tax=Leclercia adecarboxylata TaxID=83655 RepID=UPI001F059FDF|nr:hypothetical protein [Leclercia adecarboxylata]MCH2680414.1 hypothetical protein [Leclercia adecarboxylata]
MKTKLNCKFLTLCDNEEAIDTLDKLIISEDTFVTVTSSLITTITHGYEYMTIDFSDVYIADADDYLWTVGGDKVKDESIQLVYLKSKLKNLSSGDIRFMFGALAARDAEVNRDRKREQSRKDRGHDYSLDERNAVLLLVEKAYDERKLPVVNMDTDKDDEMNISLPTPKTLSIARKRARAIVRDEFGIDLPNRKKWDAWKNYDKKAFFEQLASVKAQAKIIKESHSEAI